MPRFALALVLAASLAPFAAVAQTGGEAAAGASTAAAAVNAADAAKADAAKAKPTDAAKPADAAKAAAKTPPGDEAAAPKPPPGFQAVSGAAASQPRIRATPLVVIAYLFIWAMTLLYVVYLRSRQKRVEDEIASLTRRLEKAAGE